MEEITAIIFGVCTGLAVVIAFANWYLNKPIKSEDEPVFSFRAEVKT